MRLSNITSSYGVRSLKRVKIIWIWFFAPLFTKLSSFSSVWVRNNRLLIRLHQSFWIWLRSGGNKFLSKLYFYYFLILVRFFTVNEFCIKPENSSIKVLFIITKHRRLSNMLSRPFLISYHAHKAVSWPFLFPCIYQDWLNFFRASIKKVLSWSLFFCTGCCKTFSKNFIDISSIFKYLSISDKQF